MYTIGLASLSNPEMTLGVSVSLQLCTDCVPHAPCRLCVTHTCILSNTSALVRGWSAGSHCGAGDWTWPKRCQIRTILAPSLGWSLPSGTGARTKHGPLVTRLPSHLPSNDPSNDPQVSPRTPARPQLAGPLPSPSSRAHPCQPPLRPSGHTCSSLRGVAPTHILPVSASIATSSGSISSGWNSRRHSIVALMRFLA